MLTLWVKFTSCSISNSASLTITWTFALHTRLAFVSGVALKTVWVAVIKLTYLSVWVINYLSLPTGNNLCSIQKNTIRQGFITENSSGFYSKSSSGPLAVSATDPSGLALWVSPSLHSWTFCSRTRSCCNWFIGLYLTLWNCSSKSTSFWDRHLMSVVLANVLDKLSPSVESELK